MASQTKVDSAGRTAAERRAEGSPASYASTSSASGTFAARGDARSNSGPPADELDSETSAEVPETTASEADSESEPASGDAGFAAARVSSIEELGARTARTVSAGDDEDVSLDELLISDSPEDEEEEEEATDIHPGLSEAVLAESLRGPPLPIIPVPLIPERAEEVVAEAASEEPVAVEAPLADAEEREVPLAEARAESEAEADDEAAESVPVSEERTAPDASRLEALESAPESQVDALAPALPEEALDAVAPLGDLGRDVGGQWLGQRARVSGLLLAHDQLGAT